MACAGGWALDAMDVQLYSFVIPTLIAIWGITRAQAGELGTAALLVSAVGGWLAGWLADRYGRVRTLQVAILWFAVFTFLSGLAQNFEQLFAARALMGLGFGGEWAAGAVLLGEVIRPEHRGKALGMMQAGWAVGWGTAALLYAFFFSVLPRGDRMAGVCSWSGSRRRCWFSSCGATSRNPRCIWNRDPSWPRTATSLRRWRFSGRRFCESPYWED